MGPGLGLALLLGAAAAAVLPDGDSDGYGYGVKLCGREFIRAVIFTCGGSRWKRLSLLAVEPAPDSARTPSNKLLGNFKLQSVWGPEVEQLPRSSPFLGWETFKDLYGLNDYNEYAAMADDFKEFVHQIEEAVQDRGGAETANSMGSSSFLWARYPRRKREPLGLAGMCCKWGCTKAEISTICRV
ncbi:relaxin-3-like [Phaenicophaeus curvirostris]|uniref:relaxin-3-like n=1 Tax=Phaenicophaeus curvirostris TaxID=33595 RepID=UPI0037F0C93A